MSPARAPGLPGDPTCCGKYTHLRQVGVSQARGHPSAHCCETLLLREPSPSGSILPRARGHASQPAGQLHRALIRAPPSPAGSPPPDALRGQGADVQQQLPASVQLWEPGAGSSLLLCLSFSSVKWGGRESYLTRRGFVGTRYVRCQNRS